MEAATVETTPEAEIAVPPAVIVDDTMEKEAVFRALAVSNDPATVTCAEMSDITRLDVEPDVPKLNKLPNCAFTWAVFTTKVRDVAVRPAFVIIATEADMLTIDDANIEIPALLMVTVLAAAMNVPPTTCDAPVTVMELDKTSELRANMVVVVVPVITEFPPMERAELTKDEPTDMKNGATDSIETREAPASATCDPRRTDPRTDSPLP